MAAVNSSKLERWLGADTCEELSNQMKNWYGPPIAVGNVPGKVYVGAGGDFRGEICGGGEAGAMEYFMDKVKKIDRRVQRMGKKQQSTFNMAGFSSLSDLISEATSGGKRREFLFQKVGTTSVVAGTNSLWGVGNLPSAGANASAAPGGNVPTDSSGGAFTFTNPTGTDTQHFVTGYSAANVAGNTLLLYDRLFQVNKTMASTGIEAVTGVPTRYQSLTSTDADYVGGNFLFVEVGGTALAATAHNWGVCKYNNQLDALSTMPLMAGNSGAIVRRLDHPLSQFFCPLAAGDIGVKKLTQMQCSASVATGVINFVIGHPIAFMPCPIINLVCVTDGINSAFNLARIFDDAALAFLEIVKPATTATTYNGSFTTVAG